MVAESTESDDSRRRYRRRLCAGKAFIFYEGETTLSQALQVSQGGMLIATSGEFPQHAEISVHFFLEKHYIRAKGEVIYALPDTAGVRTTRIGVRFTTIAEGDIDFIRRFTG
jgi:hypothetical protein